MCTNTNNIPNSLRSMSLVCEDFSWSALASCSDTNKLYEKESVCNKSGKVKVQCRIILSHKIGLFFETVLLQTVLDCPEFSLLDSPIDCKC